ncbi:MAG: LytR C-terminal domain-containing protein [Candidatus Yonathbacteria bacterium]|nr:LytR C-terminal domain-containing protein [Candidatus Yonathbacteria bacterium]
MSQFIQNLRIKVSEIKPRNLVYPGIISLFIIVTGVLFSFSTQFIAKNINTAFSGDTSSESSALNMTNYTLVAKKLGISTESKKNAVVEPASVASSSPASAETSQILDKKSITISILNSTTKSGVATALSQALLSAGFSKATTGNEKKQRDTTTVTIKKSSASLSDALLEEVRKIYPNATANTTGESASFDATIIIGTE